MNVTKELEDVPIKITVKVRIVDDKYIHVTSLAGEKITLARTKTLKHLERDEVYDLIKIRYYSNGAIRMIDPNERPNVAKFEMVQE